METMTHSPQQDIDGLFAARYLAFLETVTQVRPRLHRYCARMTGSVLDGEDVAQETLFQAYRKLETLPEDRPLEPWLFRIAHNRCIDFLRRRSVREDAELEALLPQQVEPAEPVGPALGPAVEHLVRVLPPKERAAVLLKDVFDYSLEEIAGLIDSTVGGVKAALFRGRTRLAALPPGAPARETRPAAADLTRLLALYVERFNRRDWDAVRELIAADARLLVTDRYAGDLGRSPYFGRYDEWSVVWRLAVGEVDGEPVVIANRREGDAWVPMHPVRFEVRDGRIQAISDYYHTPWVLSAAGSVVPHTH